MKNLFAINNFRNPRRAQSRKTAVLLLGFLCLSWFTAWGQTTRYVSSTATGANNGSSWSNAFVNLQDALDAANPGDALWVKGGTYYPTKDTSGLPSLGGRTGSFSFRKNVQLYGGFVGTETALVQRNCNALNPTVLSGDLGVLGNPVDNAIHVCYAKGLSASFVMDCFTIRDGNGTDGLALESGGGWYNDGQGASCSPSFQNCNFINNRGGLGGGFYNDGSNGGVANPAFGYCTFSDNIAEIGGGLYNNGFAGDASPQLNNCTFSQNDAGEGGGMYNNGEMGQSNGHYTDCNFNRNEANHGGAVYNYANNGTTRGEFLRCTIIDNSATQFGGGLASHGVNGDAKSTFNNCSLLRNRATSGGGGMWNNGASPWFTNCLIQENTAKNGGGVYNEGSQGLQAGPRLISCILRQNIASGRGGAMYNNALAGLTESQSIYSKYILNAASWGGAIYADGSAAGGDAQDLYYNCLFSRNQASLEGGAGYGVANDGQSAQAFASCSFSGNVAPTGSLFYLTQANGGVCNFRQYNMASHAHAGTIVSLNGGAMMEIESGIYEAGTPATCSGNCLVGQNPLFTNPAADDLTIPPSSPAVDVGDNVYFLPLYPLDLGGNVRIQGGTIDLGAYETVGAPPCPSVLYVNKIATGANNGTSWADAYLSLQSALAEARINSCIDTILIAKGTYYPTSTTNMSISFELVNDIEIYGGFPNTGNPWFPQRDLVLHETILSSDIGVLGNPNDNSLAVITAGGVPPVNIAINLNSGTIVDGLSIIGGTTGYWIRPSINGANCETVFRDVRFYGANSTGGGFAGQVSIYHWPSASITHIAPTFERCQFYDNYNTLSGGAVNLLNLVAAPTSQCIPYFKNCTFSRNEARSFGGALQVTGQVSPVFDECIFENNRAGMATTTSGGGGAIYFNMPFNSPNTAQRSKFNNCLFYDNRTNVQGGCYLTTAYATNSSIIVDFNNCTFSGHRAQLAGFGSCGGFNTEVVNFNNCIIWDNASTGNGRIMINQGIAVNNFRNTLIDVASCVDPAIRLYGSSVANCLTGMLYNQNPQFLNPASGNYRLALTSPAINSGSNALIPLGTTTDLAGNARIFAGGQVDMGCYENFPGMMRPAVYINTQTPKVYAGFGPGTALLQSLVDGGTAPYTYAWSTGATTADITVQPAQTTAYQVTVTDAQGLVLQAESKIEVINVACQRRNNQQGVVICNGGGNTVCVSVAEANALISSGSAMLGPCAGPQKQDEVIEAQLEPTLVLYPNPVGDILHLSYGDQEALGGMVLDQLGRVVLEFDGQAGEIDLHGIAQGIYIVRIQLQDVVISRRIVKE